MANAWAGLTAKEYKHLNGLHKENLRDNMTNEELKQLAGRPLPKQKPPLD